MRRLMTTSVGRSPSPATPPWRGRLVPPAPPAASCGAAYFYTFPCGLGYDLPAGEWRLIGSPCSPALPGTAVSTYGGSVPGAYGSRWILYGRDVPISQYAALAGTDPIDPGLGTWIKSLDGGTLALAGTATPVLGTLGCTGSNGCHVIALTDSDGTASAMNMIAHPFAFGVDWADVRIRVDGTTVYTPSQAQAANIASKVYYVWNGNAYEAYDDTTLGMDGTLKAYDGLWLTLLPGSAGHTVELLIPAKASIKTGQAEGALPWYLAWLDWLVPRAEAAKQPPLDASRNWYVRLTVEDPDTGMRDRNNVLGQLIDALPGYDSHDLPEMPPFSEAYLTIVFPHPDWGTQAGDYASDFRAVKRNADAGDNWTFEIRTDDPSRTLLLTWDGPEEVLKRSVLIDDETRTRIPAIERSYEVNLTTATRTLRWRYKPVK